MTADAYAFNRVDFAFETFVDEIVVLNVSEGTYFAFGGAAIEIWKPLSESQPVSSIVAAIVHRHTVSAGVVEQNIAQFIEKLTAERILLPAQPTNGATVIGEPVAMTDGFRPITFERHADMQDLLTLDPIHDVDPQKGWPRY